MQSHLRNPITANPSSQSSPGLMDDPTGPGPGPALDPGPEPSAAPDPDPAVAPDPGVAPDPDIAPDSKTPDPKHIRFSGLGDPPTGDGSANMKQVIDAHISEVDRRLQELATLGTKLVEQRKDMVERRTGIEEAENMSPELAKWMDNIAKDFIDTERDTARVLLPRQRVSSGGSGGGGGGGVGGGGVGVGARSRSSSPSKPGSSSHLYSVASPDKTNFHHILHGRRARNSGPSNRVHDIEFAAQISTSLLGQVRELQSLLAERDQELQMARAENARLGNETQHYQERIRALDDSESRFKEENWNLETRLHELTAAMDESEKKIDKLNQQIHVLRNQKSAVQRELEELKVSHGRMQDDHASAARLHETEVRTLRRDLATSRAEHDASRQQLNDARVKNQELTGAVAAANQRERQRQQDAERALLEYAAEDQRRRLDGDVRDHSPPPPSPVKGQTPGRHAGLETETLRASLHHAQRQLQGQRSLLHREKTEKLELRRLLHDTRDELERLRREADCAGFMTPPRRTRGSKKHTPQPQQARTLHRGLLGRGKQVADNDDGDGDWTDDQAGPSGIDSPSVPHGLAFRPDVPLPSVEGDDYETANETNTESFDTARSVDDTSSDDGDTEIETPTRREPPTRRSRGARIPSLSMSPLRSQRARMRSVSGVLGGQSLFAELAGTEGGFDGELDAGDENSDDADEGTGKGDAGMDADEDLQPLSPAMLPTMPSQLVDAGTMTEPVEIRSPFAGHGQVSRPGSPVNPANSAEPADPGTPVAPLGPTQVHWTTLQPVPGSEPDGHLPMPFRRMLAGAAARLLEIHMHVADIDVSLLPTDLMPAAQPRLDSYEMQRLIELVKRFPEVVDMQKTNIGLWSHGDGPQALHPARRVADPRLRAGPHGSPIAGPVNRFQNTGPSFQNAGPSLQNAGTSFQHSGPSFQHSGWSFQHSGSSLQHSGSSFQNAGMPHAPPTTEQSSQATGFHPLYQTSVLPGPTFQSTAGQDHPAPTAVRLAYGTENPDANAHLLHPANEPADHDPTDVFKFASDTTAAEPVDPNEVYLNSATTAVETQLPGEAGDGNDTSMSLVVATELEDPFRPASVQTESVRPADFAAESAQPVETTAESVQHEGAITTTHDALQQPAAPTPITSDRGVLTDPPAPASLTADCGVLTDPPAPAPLTADCGVLTDPPAPASLTADCGVLTDPPAPASLTADCGVLTDPPAPMPLTTDCGVLTDLPAPASAPSMVDSGTMTDPPAPTMIHHGIQTEPPTSQELAQLPEPPAPSQTAPAAPRGTRVASGSTINSTATTHGSAVAPIKRSISHPYPPVSMPQGYRGKEIRMMVAPGPGGLYYVPVDQPSAAGSTSAAVDRPRTAPQGAMAPPPLPPNHKQALEAARAAASMPPPLGTMSAGARTGRPSTPAAVPTRPMSSPQQTGRTAGPGVARAASAHGGAPASGGNSTPGNSDPGNVGALGGSHMQPPTMQQMMTATMLSNRSSMSSFASEVETRFNPERNLRTSQVHPLHSNPVTGPGGNFGSAAGLGRGCDPRMVQFITQTIIGEFLWKYTRRTGRNGISLNRHQRYFWIHPYTRTLYWSNAHPSTHPEQSAKCVPIQGVREVDDDNDNPPGLYNKSLVIISPGRSIKLTCPTGARHDIWLNALSYLLKLTEESDAEEADDMDGMDDEVGVSAATVRGGPPGRLPPPAHPPSTLAGRPGISVSAATAASPAYALKPRLAPMPTPLDASRPGPSYPNRGSPSLKSHHSRPGADLPMDIPTLSPAKSRRDERVSASAPVSPDDAAFGMLPSRPSWLGSRLSGYWNTLRTRSSNGIQGHGENQEQMGVAQVEKGQPARSEQQQDAGRHEPQGEAARPGQPDPRDEAYEATVHSQDPRASYEASRSAPHDAARLDNVRACCAGKHDVGTLSHTRRGRHASLASLNAGRATPGPRSASALSSIRSMD